MVEHKEGELEAKVSGDEKEYDVVIRKMYVLREGWSQAALHAFEYRLSNGWGVNAFYDVKHYSPQFRLIDT